MATSKARKTTEGAGAKSAGKAKGTTRTRAVAEPGSRTPRLPKDLATAIAAIHDKKAEDVVLLDLRKTGGFTDYFVICTASNTRQMAAMADAVQDSIRELLGERPTLAEGVDKSEWILLDYFSFVVHIFSRECREFYALERLWGNAVRHELDDSKA